MMETKWKYTDPKAMPVPLKKLGDIVYTSCPWRWEDYDHISRCEVRKIEVIWCEEHWNIFYYLRTDVGTSIQSSRQAPYFYEDGHERTIFDTPQEVIERNVKRFFESTQSKMNGIVLKMRSMGYTDSEIRQVLDPRRIYEEIGKHDERALR